MRDRQIHFISGLPRSGSTLLVALLRQNPAFVADINSPVAHMVATMQETMSGKSDFHGSISDSQRRGVLRGIVGSYFAETDPERTVFDSNRNWCSKLAMLSQLFPEAKVICCVRSLSWIFDSFERLVVRNALEPSRIFNYETLGNVYTRVEYLNDPRLGTVGAAYRNLREAFYGEHSGRLLLINYETLAKSPQAALNALYGWVGATPFTHDCENVRLECAAFDQKMGMAGLHTVAGKVCLKERQSILPPDIFSRFANTAFWAEPAQNTRSVKVI